jgi:hypothetical protein
MLDLQKFLQTPSKFCLMTWNCRGPWSKPSPTPITCKALAKGNFQQRHPHHRSALPHWLRHRPHVPALPWPPKPASGWCEACGSRISGCRLRLGRA